MYPKISSLKNELGFFLIILIFFSATIISLIGQESNDENLTKARQAECSKYDSTYVIANVDSVMNHTGKIATGELHFCKNKKSEISSVFNDFVTRENMESFQNQQELNMDIFNRCEDIAGKTFNTYYGKAIIVRAGSTIVESRFVCISKGKVQTLK